jgi:hypothetical protein
MPAARNRVIVCSAPGISAAGQEMPQPLLEHLKRRRRDLRRLLGRVAPQREFGEQAQLVRAAPGCQFLLGKQDPAFGKGGVIGRQHRAVVPQGGAHQVGHHQQRALGGRSGAHLIYSFGGSRSI